MTGQMNFGSNMRGSAAYREQLSKVLLRRGFEQLEERRENKHGDYIYIKWKESNPTD